MRFLKILALLAFIAVLLIFFQQNTEVLNTSLRFQLEMFGNLWQSVQMPLYLVVVAAFFLGGVLTLLYFFLEKMRASGQLRACRSQVAKLEQEVNSLRNLPLQESYPTTTTSTEESAYITPTEDKTKTGL